MPLIKIILHVTALTAFLLSPKSATADTQEQFFVLWQEYQRFCGLMLANPEAFHNDPQNSFGLTGDVLYGATDDQSHKDYTLETSSPNPMHTRVHQMVSSKTSQYVEQSCLVSEYSSSRLPQGSLDILANGITTAFKASPAFEITGGKRGIVGETNSEYIEYFFVATGAFQGQVVMTFITLNASETTIEHVKLTQIPR